MIARVVEWGRAKGERGAAGVCFTASFRGRKRADGSVPARRLLGIGALLPQRSALLSCDWLVTLTSTHHQSLPPPPPGAPAPHLPSPPPDTHSTSSTLPLISLLKADAMMDTAWEGARGGYRSSLQVAPVNGAGPPPPPRTKRCHKRCVKSRGSGGEEGRDNII